jgi:5'-nucleotidase
MEKKLDVVIGKINTELDGRFSAVRTRETNLGNFICDTILEAVHADCAILNSGTFRSDTLHPKGEFKMKDLKAILPFVDTIVAIKCTGKLFPKLLKKLIYLNLFYLIIK